MSARPKAREFDITVTVRTGAPTTRKQVREWMSGRVARSFKGSKLDDGAEIEAVIVRRDVDADPT